MAKPTAADIKALTDAELEGLQLAVNAEVAVRIQNTRLEERLVTALSDAQGVGFTDADIDSIFAKSRDRVKKGRQDPARLKGPRSMAPGENAKDFTDPLPSKATIDKERKPAT